MQTTDFSYVECSIPEAMTVEEYRRSRPQPRRRLRTRVRAHRMPRLVKLVT
jgi:hypothetical protein